MPKTLYIPKDAKRSGIDITWIPSKSLLQIGGWYDSFVGLERRSMTLCQFFQELGITEKKVKAELKNLKEYIG